MAEKIIFRDGNMIIPDEPFVAYIEGDGIGADITPAMLMCMRELNSQPQW